MMMKAYVSPWLIRCVMGLLTSAAIIGGLWLVKEAESPLSPLVVDLVGAFTGDEIFDDAETSTAIPPPQNKSADLDSGTVGTNLNTTGSEPIYYRNPLKSNDTHITTCTLEARLKHMRTKCAKPTWSTEIRRSLQGISVDQEYKLLYCTPPKVSSSTVRLYFEQLHQEDRTPLRRPFNNLTEAEQQVALRDYFKFIIVRHPLERLHSAWKDRVNTAKFPEIIRLLEKYLKPDPNTGVADLNNVPFIEFLVALEAEYKSGFRNNHWEPYDVLCGVCQIPYQYVFRLEALDVESVVLLDHLTSLNSSTEFPPLGHRNVRSRVSNYDKMHELKNILRGASPWLISNLLAIYYKDMELFGYQWDSDKGATCEIPTVEGQTSHTCC